MRRTCRRCARSRHVRVVDKAAELPDGRRLDAPLQDLVEPSAGRNETAPKIRRYAAQDTQDTRPNLLCRIAIRRPLNSAESTRGLAGRRPGTARISGRPARKVTASGAIRHRCVEVPLPGLVERVLAGRGVEARANGSAVPFPSESMPGLRARADIRGPPLLVCPPSSNCVPSWPPIPQNEVRRCLVGEAHRCVDMPFCRSWSARRRGASAASLIRSLRLGGVASPPDRNSAIRRFRAPAQETRRPLARLRPHDAPDAIGLSS